MMNAPDFRFQSGVVASGGVWWRRNVSGFTRGSKRERTGRNDGFVPGANQGLVSDFIEALPHVFIVRLRSAPT